MTTNLTIGDFESTVLGNPIVLVDFWASGADPAAHSGRSSTAPRQRIPTSCTRRSIRRPSRNSPRCCRSARSHDHGLPRRGAGLQPGRRPAGAGARRPHQPNQGPRHDRGAAKLPPRSPRRHRSRLTSGYLRPRRFMCYPVQCPKCGKTSWGGCGQHVDSVMRSVPASQDAPAPRSRWAHPSLALEHDGGDADSPRRAD